MHRAQSRWLIALSLALAACVGGPTQEDIENDLERQLRSVAGPWDGASPTLTLNFQLTQGAGNAVSGSGTMKEAAAPTTVPITVTGAFQRPQLSLTISGMTYDGHAVQGTFQGSYTTAGGISGPLHLTGTGYAHDVTILLQER
jgi:hypothetical protein